MARAPARFVPASSARFSVDLGIGNAGQDVRQVVLPRLLAGKDSTTTGPLILRRIASADRQFHDWWSAALTTKDKPRTVTVSLLQPDMSAVLFAWRFLNVRPVALTYGVLDGAEDLPLDETLELAFERMERV